MAEENFERLYTPKEVISILYIYEKINFFCYKGVLSIEDYSKAKDILIYAKQTFNHSRFKELSTPSLIENLNKLESKLKDSEKITNIFASNNSS